MVMAPDSEFFNYLKNAEPKAAAPAAAPAAPAASQ